MRPFNIIDNKEDIEGNKKVIMIANNNQCKSIKKGKYQIIEKIAC